MKLRIKGSSLRLRLTRTEIGALGCGRPVREEIGLGNGPHRTLSYVVRPEPRQSEIQVGFDGHEICVRIPDQTARELSETDRVGIVETLLVAPDRSIEIKVEKDFECLSPRPGEDDSDAFPHPKNPIKTGGGT